MLIKIINAVLTVAGVLAGTAVLFWAMNALVERLSPRWEQRLKPYVFIGPAIAVLALFLVYPTVRTFILSFYGASSEEFVGLQNYREVATDPVYRSILFNNLLWIIFVPLVAVAVGLGVATLADRLKPRWENFSKSVIFLPMAISFVGASTIWGFMYAFEPAGQTQIGLFNAIWTAFGGQPQAWLQISTASFNDFLLIAIMIWLQAGFAMVLLSAAIKNVPDETLEAARIDGATELQIFWRVTVPQIKSTIAVVATTILILVLKVFDVVYVLTGGNFDTGVIASRFITELFNFRQFGRAAVLVVVLIIATIPFMVYNIRRFRAEEAT